MWIESRSIDHGLILLPRRANLFATMLAISPAMYQLGQAQVVRKYASLWGDKWTQGLEPQLLILIIMDQLRVGSTAGYHY